MPEDLDIHTDRKVYSIPDGLNELMYDISKEVIRCQPKNLYQFISDYLITLLKVREAVKVAVPLIEKEFDTAESQINFLKKYNLSKEQADRFATIIQAAYRGYRTRKKLLHIADDFSKADDASQFTPPSDEGFFADPMLSFLKTRGISKEQTKEAATKIQAYFRGFRMRKLEKQKGLECLIQGVPSHESWRHDWLNEPFIKKDSGQEVYPWRKSFADFHKNFLKRHEGDRLHIETIYGGKYEDYNRVCDQTSCQEFIIPTSMEAKELGVPGDIESSASEELDIPGAQIMRDIVETQIKETPVSYEMVEKELEFFKKLSEVKISEAAGPGLIEIEKTTSEISGHSLKQDASIKSSRMSKKSDAAISVTGSQKSEGGKSQGSKKSGSLKSKGSAKSASDVPPELSVRALSATEEQTERGEEAAEEQAVSEASEVSTAAEEKRASKVSRKSSSVSKAEVVAAEEAEKISKGSKSSKGSKKSVSSHSSKKSLAQAEPQEE